MNAIDAFLNGTTMFRLLVYYLLTLLGAAFALSIAGVLPFSPAYLAASSAFLVAVAWLSNLVFARIWDIPFNIESSLITGLILSLIIAPGRPDQQFFPLFFAALLAVSSKYVLAIRGKHIFNPAAFGVATMALAGQSASWWVAGNLPLLPFVLGGGILVVRKIRRADLVLSYLAAALAASAVFKFGDPAATWAALRATVLHTSLLFFAFVMITEPLTTPPRRPQRIAYGAIVGVLSAPWANIGGIYFTPELALLAGNLFSFAVSPKFKSVLRFSSARRVAEDTYELVFAGPPPRFVPGQYAEFTIPAGKADDRGNRRYFTLASSPTERDIRLGVKFYREPSAFKELLAEFRPSSRMLAGSVAGDFVLPDDPEKKLVFIAGGIGVTPFRSIVKYLLDTKEKRDIVLFYANRSEGEIAYRDVFDEAARAGIGLRVVYALTGADIGSGWKGERGYIDEAMIRRHVPDFDERYYYISGSQAMVNGFSAVLSSLGVPRWRLKKDYFPGFAG